MKIFIPSMKIVVEMSKSLFQGTLDLLQTNRNILAANAYIFI